MVGGRQPVSRLLAGWWLGVGSQCQGSWRGGGWGEAASVKALMLESAWWAVCERLGERRSEKEL